MIELTQFYLTSRRFHFALDLSNSRRKCNRDHVWLDYPRAALGAPDGLLIMKLATNWYCRLTPAKLYQRQITPTVTPPPSVSCRTEHHNRTPESQNGTPERCSDNSAGPAVNSCVENDEMARSAVAEIWILNRHK